jgi:hypothetical protein
VILETTYQSTFRKRAHAMTAPHVIDPARFLTEQLEQASPDLMRSMLTTFINALMSAEADAVCGAEYGARSETRTNSRNGYLHRAFLGAVICCTPYRHTVKQLSVQKSSAKFQSSRLHSRLWAEKPSQTHASGPACGTLAGLPSAGTVCQPFSQFQWPSARYVRSRAGTVIPSCGTQATGRAAWS